MFSKERLKRFVDVYESIVNAPSHSLAQFHFEKHIHNYKNEFEFFISLEEELKSKITLKIVPNNYKEFDFENDVGKLIYAYLKEDKKLLQQIFNSLPIYIQKLFFYVFLKKLTSKLNEDLYLQYVDNYYRLSKIISLVSLPDFLDIDGYTLQGLSRFKIEKLQFPCDLIRIPKRFKYYKIGYLIKENGKIISNINSSLIRNELLEKINYSTFGIIGVILKEKKYKRKYKFLMLYFNEDVKNVIDIYRNKGINKNKIDLVKINSELLLFQTKKPIKNSEEFLELIKKHKYSKSSILILPNGIEYVKTKVEFDVAPIIDYIYNDNFDAIGLVIKYKDTYYNLYFNVMNTSYINGIENRFVKISVIKYLDEIIAIHFNSEIKKWHSQYEYCKLCESVKYKHHSNGICNKCYAKLEQVADNVYSKQIILPCDKKFSIICKSVSFNSNGYELVVTPKKYTQLSLPLFDIDICKNLNLIKE